MPKQRKNRFVAGQYFQWKIYRRGQVFYADGRSNKISAGKHSLGTTDPDEVQTLLYQLDLKKAIELGLAEPKATPAYTRRFPSSMD